MNLLVTVVGPPCSGKTSIITGAHKEIEKSDPQLHLCSFSAGDVARGQDFAAESLSKGELAPARFDMIMSSHIKGLEILGSHDIVFVDGYPRYQDQLSDLLLFTHIPKAMVYIELQDATEIARRAKARERGDDKHIFTRLSRWVNRGGPMIDWVKSREPFPFLTVDGYQPVSTLSSVVGAWVMSILIDPKQREMR